MLNKLNVTKEFNRISLDHKTVSLNKEDFHQFINGFYQAEGTAGAYFRKKEDLNVYFSFSIGQNYSPEALIVFLNLQKILGVGTIKLEFNEENKAHIRFIVSNTKDIFEKVLPYFSLLYGQKRRDLAKLKLIYTLGANNLNSKLDSTFVCEYIHLVYSINPEGQERKVSLIEKLNLFYCSSVKYKDNLEVKENNNLPSKLFIIGFYLGDGSLGFVFNSPPSRLPKFYIKIVFNFASQSNTKDNVNLLKLIAERMNLKPHISARQSGMVGLEYVGETVFNVILPFLAEHQDWLFWKTDQFINAQKIAKLFKDKSHLTKDGLLLIINLLYSRPNKYLKPKEFWLDLINKRFKTNDDHIEPDKTILGREIGTKRNKFRIPVLVLDLKTKESFKHVSIAEAARSLNTHPKTIWRVIYNNKLYLNRYQIIEHYDKDQEKLSLMGFIESIFKYIYIKLKVKSNRILIYRIFIYIVLIVLIYIILFYIVIFFKDMYDRYIFILCENRAKSLKFILEHRFSYNNLNNTHTGFKFEYNNHIIFKEWRSLYLFNNEWTSFDSTNNKLGIYQSIINEVNLDFNKGTNTFSVVNSSYSSPIIDRVNINSIFSNAIASTNIASDTTNSLGISGTNYTSNRNFVIVDNALINTRLRTTELLNYQSNILYCIINGLSPSTY